MDNFNEFITSIKNKKNINYFDFLHLINACNVHYNENNLDSVKFTGIKSHENKKQKNKYLQEQNRKMKNVSNCFTNYYIQPAASNFFDSVEYQNEQNNMNNYFINTNSYYDDLYYWKSSNSNLSDNYMNYYINKNKTFYEESNKENINIGVSELRSDKSIIRKEEIISHTKIKKNIDFNIETIDDLIKLIDNNSYSEKYEYNIDIKGLHNIKPELQKLNDMIGIQSLKNSVLNQLIYFIQEPILGNISDYKHTILCGPPGTGKTEIAKILGQMYCKIGVLKKNVFKKVTRNELVAGYLGQTAIKTKDVINSCIGGCLFIDEAYSLGSNDNNDSFAKECVDTLCEAMSDHKDDLMVIVAGYEEDLNNHFFSINRGLESRFFWKFHIEKYSPKEMVEIFEKKIKEQNWKLTEELNNKKMIEWIDKKKDNFKNFGRDIENFFAHVKICHSRRIYGKNQELLKKISIDDLDNGYKNFLANGKKQEKKYCSLYL